MQQYKEQLWFGPDFGYKPHDNEIRKYLESDRCPLNKFIGNKEATDLMKAVAFFALRNNNHAVVDRSTGRDEKINIALIGSAGLGKTTLAKLFAETIVLPFGELHQISKPQDIFDAANKALTPYKTPIGLSRSGRPKVQPMVMFADEVHKYSGKSRKSPSGVMNDLLKATEPDDAILANGNKWVLDCSNICWIVATTEWHLMPKPFRTRFMEVKLLPYTEDDVTGIVQSRFPAIPENVCRQAAVYGCLVPRQALNFAKMFSFQKGFRNLSWDVAADVVAEKKGIDEWGMTSERREVLTILGKYGICGKDKLAMYSGQDEVELLDNILPPLANPAVGDPMIKHGPKGWSLLPAGREELEKRGITCSDAA